MDWLSRHWGKLLIGTALLAGAVVIIFLPPAATVLAEAFAVTTSTVVRGAAIGGLVGEICVAGWMGYTEASYQDRQERRENAAAALRDARAAEHVFQENANRAAELAARLQASERERQRLEEENRRLVARERQRLEGENRRLIEDRQRLEEENRRLVARERQRLEEENRPLRGGEYHPGLYQNANNLSDTKVDAGGNVHVGPQIVQNYYLSPS
ncbi:MAG: hypothetical protein K0Q74_955 [Gammaproteobacteria bacterium]|jgi:hypothetical protein|nr:hypothetical protein [Gammaproteobacteria bacterium]